MNYDRVPKGLRWMQTTSFFHAAYEGLLVNELRYLQLIEHKVSRYLESSMRRALRPSPLCSSGWISRFHRPRSSRHLDFTRRWAFVSTA